MLSRIDLNLICGDQTNVSRIPKSKETARRQRDLFVSGFPKPTSLQLTDGDGSATHPSVGKYPSHQHQPRLWEERRRPFIDECGYREAN